MRPYSVPTLLSRCAAASSKAALEAYLAEMPETSYNIVTLTAEELVITTVDGCTKVVLEERRFPKSDEADAWESAHIAQADRQETWMLEKTKAEIEAMFDWP